MTVRVRFAPSPTGFLHIGSARTALFNYLFAKRMGGQFILRIEDTDMERSKKEFEKDILDGLKWLGLSWDEGPGAASNQQSVVGSSYYQSERTEIYLKYVNQLLETGKAYEQEGAVFYRIPTVGANGEKGETVLSDLVRGKIVFQNKEFKDQVIRKSDGSPTYNFAVVVDDALMGITHVIRGEDHISNTPKQIFLYQALGFKLPEFAHIPLILAPDRSKLSKRHGAVSITEYRSMGYLPEAMINYLSLLGWTPKQFPNPKNELMTVPEIIERFEIPRIGKSGAIFEFNKLSWINGQKIRALPIDQLEQLVYPYLLDEIKSAAPEWRLSLLTQLKDSLTLASDISELQRPFTKTFEIPKDVLKSADEKRVAALFSQKLNNNLFNETDSIHKLLDEIEKETGLKKKEILMPLRAALTGTVHGLPVQNICILLGKEETLKRLKYVS
jgi:glutamyl-tRNA synthetase